MRNFRDIVFLLFLPNKDLLIVIFNVLFMIMTVNLSSVVIAFACVLYTTSCYTSYEIELFCTCTCILLVLILFSNFELIPIFKVIQKLGQSPFSMLIFAKND